MEIFDIKKYKGKYVMHTVTREQYDEFCEYLDSIGKRWASGKSFAEECKYDEYQEDTCVNFNLSDTDVSFSDVEFYKHNNCIILEMEDFIMPKKQFTKADLKTGDFVQRRDGVVCVVLKEYGAITHSKGFDLLNNYKDDLISKNNLSRLDIMAVHRPIDARDCQFERFAQGRAKLIYERKEVEEMTLEQVCKLLGKEIKIVKG